MSELRLASRVPKPIAGASAFWAILGTGLIVGHHKGRWQFAPIGELRCARADDFLRSTGLIDARFDTRGQALRAFAAAAAASGYEIRSPIRLRRRPDGDYQTPDGTYLIRRSQPGPRWTVISDGEPMALTFPSLPIAREIVAEHQLTCQDNDGAAAARGPW